MAELIKLPLKTPSDIDLIKPLQNVIKSTYNSASEPKDYTESIISFSKLRNNALSVWRSFENRESSLEVIYNYYDQIVALEHKIPSNELQIPFKWKDAFDRTIFGSKLSLTISSLAYEKVCVLFNIAALQSSIASSQSLESDEGLKLAAKLFQQSAGIFNYLKGNVMLAIHQEPTPDMSPETLNALSSLMLAQSQEIFVHKAIHDNMKDGIIAKLASQAEEYFGETLKLFQKEILRNLWEKTWIPLIASKQEAYRAMAEFYQSLVCRSNKIIGEQLSRLDRAIELFKSAQVRSNVPTLFQDYLNKAQRNYNEVKKDNDFIYHERIPDVSSLEPIGKAAIAKLLPIPEHFSASFHDLFSELLPVSVHQALANFQVRKNEVMNTEIGKLREMQQILNGVLTNLNLPAAIEDVSGTEIPQSLLDKAAFVRQSGGIESLENMMKDLPELFQRNKEILDEAESLLRTEEESDNHLKAQFKEKWTRLPSSKLTVQFHTNANKYRGIINNAIAADKVVKEKFETNRRGIEIMSKDPSEIMSEIPSGCAVQESDVVLQLRSLMNDVDALKAEQEELENLFKSTTIDMQSVFLSALAKDGTIDEPNLTMENIGGTFGPLQKRVREVSARQEALLAQIQVQLEQLQSKNKLEINNKSLHTAFTNEQSGSGSDRESILCMLAGAHDAFKDLRSHLQEGAKFYNDLTRLLIVFQTKISDFCFARKTEKEELLKDLTSNLGQSAPAAASSVPTYRGESTSHTDGSSTLPYPTHTGNMPIPFGATPNVPYPTYIPPPMPATYNPYFTMPYPMQGGYQQQDPSQVPWNPYGGYSTMPH